MGADRAFLSIVSWPAGWGTSRCVEALVAAAGLDPGQAKLAVARGVPQVVAIIDAGVRDDVLAVLHADGVLALAPSRADLASWGEPVRAKRLFLFPGGDAIGIEPWRGEHAVVRTADVGLIVRGSNRVTTTTVRPAEGTMDFIDPRFHVGAAAQRAFDPTDQPVSRDVKTTLVELIDVYASGAGPRWVRVDADKMNFDVLEGEKGITDRDNTDKLAVLLAASCPGARFDIGFETFGVPAHLFGRRGSAGRTAAFDFYSAWAACVQREMGAL